MSRIAAILKTEVRAPQFLMRFHRSILNTFAPGAGENLSSAVLTYLYCAAMLPLFITFAIWSTGAHHEGIASAFIFGGMCAVVILAICFIAPRLAMRYASTAPIRHSAILSQICPISLLAFMLWVSADYGWRVDHGLTSPSDNPAWWSYLRPMLIVSMGTGMPAMMFFFLTSMAHKDTIAKSDGRRWNVGIIAVFSVGMTICAAIYLFTRYGH